MNTWLNLPALALPGHLAGHTITRFLAGELPTAAAERAQRHLVGCPRCARRCEEQQFAHHMLRRLTLDRPLPAARHDDLRRQLSTSAPHLAPQPLRFLRAAAHTRRDILPARPTSPPDSRRGSSFWAVAAVLIVALTSALLIGSHGPLTGSHSLDNTTGTVVAGVPAGWDCAPPPTENLADPASWASSHMALNSVVMLSPTEGWAVGEYVGSRGAILANVGGSWLLDYTTPPAVLRSISLATPVDGWAVGEDCTHPGHAIMAHLTGTIWTQVDASAFGPLTSVAMLTPSNGWAAGPNTLLHYDGTLWSPVPIQHATGATSLALLSATNGWVVGASGTILRGDGTHWTPVAGGNGPDLNALAFASPDEGWAVGGYPSMGGPGALAHYHHGRWSLVSAPELAELFGICMVSPTEGWAVGGLDQGVVVHYTAGHWSVTPLQGLPGLRAVAMISAKEGWAVGLNGALIHFHDGVWDQQFRALW